MLFASTLLFALATELGVLLIARILQGASSAVVYTVGLALLVDTVGQEGMGVWMGFALSGMSVGMMIGPFLGGIIYTKAGYHAVFIMLLGFIAFDFILRLFMIEKKVTVRWKKNVKDVPGYGTFSDDPNASDSPDGVGTDGTCNSAESDFTSSSGRTEVESIHQPLNSEERPVSSAQTKRPRVMTRLWKRVSTRSPVMYKLLSSPRLVAALYGAFVSISIVASMDSVLPIFMQKTFDWESSGTGVIFLALSIPSLASPILGALSDRLGTRKVVLTGFTVAAIALALLALIRHDNIGQIVLLCVLLALIGTSHFLEE